MTIPKYIKEILSRATYEYDECINNENYAVGYTLRINKSTPYTKVATLNSEINKLVEWANRNGGDGTAHILKIPKATHYTTQYAIVTIYDSLMLKLEKYIGK